MYLAPYEENRNSLSTIENSSLLANSRQELKIVFIVFVIIIIIIIIIT